MPTTTSLFRSRTRGLTRLGCSLAVLLLIGVDRSMGATFTVTSTADVGAGSLRAAITSANGAAGADTIMFAIAGGGVKTITLASALPTITQQVFIDGFTQSGSTASTQWPGSDASMLIEINGNNAIATALTVSASICHIRGLVINRCTAAAIDISPSAASVEIRGNYFGLNPAGTVSSGIGSGLIVRGASCIIGGWATQECNRFSGATGGAALLLTGTSATGAVILQNLFGLGADGTSVIGGFQNAIRITAGANLNVIGALGYTPNFITGATGAGIAITGATTIGNAINRNVFQGNGGLAIDLNDDGLTANDGGDGDAGPNDLINFPVLSRAYTDNYSSVWVDMTYQGLASHQYMFTFYASPTGDPSTHGEGSIYLGWANLITDGSGAINKQVCCGLWNVIPAGYVVSAYVLDEWTGSTSEFSNNVTTAFKELRVTNNSDVVNGTTADVMQLIDAPGADGISLREAIMATNNTANAQGLADDIFFNLPGAGVQTISPSSPLPVITGPVRIAGGSDPEFVQPTPVVRIDGISAGAGAHGIEIGTDGGLDLSYVSITRFTGNGVYSNPGVCYVNGCYLGVTPAGAAAGNGGAGVYCNGTGWSAIGYYYFDPNIISDNDGGGVVFNNCQYTTVARNRIGTNIAGSAALGSQPEGVVLQGGTRDCTVGQAATNGGNLISGHSMHGVRSTGSNDNVFYMNMIGTDINGNASIPNVNTGMMIESSNGNDIGASGYGNQVSGNSGDAIFIRDNSTNNVVAGNLVGTRADGLTTLANGAEGVTFATGAHHNTLGGTTAGERNIIAGNTGLGVHLSASPNNTIIGNYIGVNSSGAARPNQVGVFVETSNDNTIGGSTAGERNIISGNLDQGIYAQGGSSGNTIKGNYIGTNPAGTAAVPNVQEGIMVRDGLNNTIGGATAAEGNVISGNGVHGVMIYSSSSATSFNTVRNNRIGTNASGTGAIANANGINIYNGATQNTVQDNLISGNTGYGLTISGASTNTAQANKIGTNAAGTAALPNGNGVWVTGGASNQFLENQISGNTGWGLLLDATNSSVVRGNLIGVNATGAAALANGSTGIKLQLGSSGTVIGGTLSTERNVIAANPTNGIELDNAPSTTIQGNYIGVNATGTAALGGQATGILVHNTPNTIIGGSASGAGNVISGHSANGVLVTGSASTVTLIHGNRIGTNAAGTAALGNGQYGVRVGTGTITTNIGAAVAGSGNQISGNNSGIYYEVGSTGTVVGNLIGTNAGGSAALGNTNTGIFIRANSITVGGPSAAERNVISGNGAYGVNIDASFGGGGNNVIVGNYIGTNAAGTASISSVGPTNGIFMSGNANRIGGVGAGEGNVISGHGDVGLRIDGGTNSIVEGNLIGTNAAGTAAVPNLNGIRVKFNATGTTIGGTTAAHRNVVSGNASAGVFIDNSGGACNGTTIQGNYIGTNSTGSAAIGNGNCGIFEGGGAVTGLVIGGGVVGAGNVISGNTNDGIRLNTANAAQIKGNFIGTNASGSAAIANTQDGININCNNTAIGGAAALERNVLSGNARDGISIITGNAFIKGNYCGLNAAGNGFIPNGQDGISLLGSNSVVGGLLAGEGNTCAGNVRHGIDVWMSATNNHFTGNSTYDNGGLGIDLGADGADWNDLLDVDNGENGHQNYPVINWAVSAGGNTHVDGSLHSKTNTTYRIEFFSSPTADPSTYGEGRTYLGELTGVLTDGSGNADFTAVLTGVSVTPGHVVTATATDPLLNTSEFSISLAASAGSDISGTVFEDVNYGGGAGRDANTAIGAGGSARPNARVELYDALGNFISTTTTDVNGNYIFSGLVPDTYAVRVVNSSVSSGRVGYVASMWPVQTFRTDASTGSVVAATDRVGGEVPNKVDAGNGSTTLAALNTATTTAQSLTTVTLGGTSLTSVDFGYSFDVVCNANGTGQGSLRQFITNANGLGSDAALNQAGLVTVKENAVFMISNGTAAAGLRAANNYFTAGIATISPGSALPGISGTLVLDAQKQPGWTLNPIIEINGATAGSNRCFDVAATATGSIFRGFIVNRYNKEFLSSAANNLTIQGNWVGLNNLGTADQGNGLDLGSSGIYLSGNGSQVGGTTAAQRNVISGNDYAGIWIDGDNNVVSGNYIGTDATGTADLGNTDNGIFINDGSTGNTIGGTAAGAGNVISGNNAVGVSIWGPTSGAGNNVIVGNIIGLNAAGTAALGNTSSGVVIEDARNNTVGGTSAAHRNVISGNGYVGVEITSANGDNNVIQGNYIGLNAAGTAAIGNANDGISLYNGPQNTTIGGTSVGARNVISGNGGDGIQTEGAATTGNFIQGNYIGTNAVGTVARPNAFFGVYLYNGSTTTTVGGTAAGAGNLISGNTTSGIGINDSGSNQVLGNVIGLNAAGNAALANQSGGLRLMGNSANNVIGGTTAGARNVISGNTGSGVLIGNTSGTGNAVAGNYIGTNVAGTAAVPNTQDGVDVTAASAMIGGSTAAHGNVISGNGLNGIRLQGGANGTVVWANTIGLAADGATDLGNGSDGIDLTTDNNLIGAGGPGNVISGNVDDGIDMRAGASGNLVRGNFIGLNSAGTAARPNDDNGLVIEGDNNTIGGTAGGQGNVISGNGSDGVELLNATANNNLIVANTIGLSNMGNSAIANGADGIKLAGGAHHNTIGGSGTNARNFISGNTQNGVMLTGGTTTNNTVLGNFIGTEYNGTTALPNSQSGIAILSGATNNTIGGTVASMGNVIAGNTQDGIRVTGSPSNTIQANYIGCTNAYAALANGQNGIRLQGAGTTGTMIGGTNAGEGNTIYSNTLDGVNLESTTGIGNRILRNSISGNGALGIDLQDDGVTPNDAGDTDGGSNARQNFPVLYNASTDGSSVVITGQLVSAPSTTYRIDFYNNPSGTEDATGHGEGRVYLGFTTLSTNAAGSVNLSTSLPGTVALGDRVSATATPTTGPDAGSTSEFSMNVVAIDHSISGTVFEDVNYGGGAGRDKSTSFAGGGTGRPNARVELFDGTGNLLAFTTTDASGNYSFTGVMATNYIVRVVNSTVSSARTGYVAGLVPVQTFRSYPGSLGPVQVVDRVGGEVPSKLDAGNASTTLAALTTASTTAQSFSSVSVTIADLTGVDFGFNFDVIVNTNATGQGSLAQFITNASTLGGETALAQAGTRISLAGAPEPLPAGMESSVFMIADGAVHPGLNAGYANLLTGGVAAIAPNSLPAITDGRTIIDGTTQTVNVGNNNASVLGTGGLVGTDALTLSQVPGPEVQVNMSSTGAIAFDVQADTTTVRGLAVLGAHNAGSAVRLTDGTKSAVIELNVLGSSATSFTDPGAAIRTTQNIESSGADSATVRNNLIGFGQNTGIYMPNNSNGWSVEDNELRDNGISWINGDNLALNTSSGANVRGNLIVGAPTQGIIINTVTASRFENNTVTGNGVGTITNMSQSTGITVRLGCSGVTFDRNIVQANYGAGFQVNPASSGITLTRNSISDNGTIIARNGAGPTGQIGIDLNGATEDINFGTAPFYTLNDAGDGDTGGNDLQNFPVLSSSVYYGLGTYIQGSLNSTPGTNFTIEFFSSPTGDPSGYGEGSTFLGAASVTTNGAGNAIISANLVGVTVAVGHRVSATATRAVSGSTSEFSSNVVNALDLDLDNDGIANAQEPGDTDGDGVADMFDLDGDNDGIYDVVESGVGAPHTNGVLNGAINPNGIPVAADTNGDGTTDYVIDDSDSDNDPDHVELDSDADGCSDVVEAGFIDTNGDGTPGQAPITVDVNGLVTSLVP